MALRSAVPYRPMTPSLSWPERIADALIMGILVFWFAFLGLAPRKQPPAPPKRTSIPQIGRPEKPPERPLDDDRPEPQAGIVAE